jgi:hypothetical protein
VGKGEKLRAAALKVRQKVPKSDKPVTLRANVVPDYEPAYQEKPAAVPTTLVDFGQVCEVRNLSVEKAQALLGDYVAGDREFIFPAALVTEDQLRTAGAVILYGSEELAPKRIDPTKAPFGVVTKWRVLARLKKSGNG